MWIYFFELLPAYSIIMENILQFNLHLAQTEASSGLLNVLKLVFQGFFEPITFYFNKDPHVSKPKDEKHG